jgi:hypothetical protein
LRVRLGLEGLGLKRLGLDYILEGLDLKIDLRIFEI